MIMSHMDKPIGLWARSGVSRDVSICDMTYSYVTCLIRITLNESIFIGNVQCVTWCVNEKNYTSCHM